MAGRNGNGATRRAKLKQRGDALRKLKKERHKKWVEANEHYLTERWYDATKAKHLENFDE